MCANRCGTATTRCAAMATPLSSWWRESAKKFARRWGAFWSCTPCVSPCPMAWPRSCCEAFSPVAGSDARTVHAAVRSGAGRLRELRGALRARRPDETAEQRVPVARGGGELRVELRRQEPRVVGQLDHLHQAVAREPREAHARLPIAVEVVVVEFIAVPMALHDGIAAIELARARAGPEQHLLGPEAHGGALGGS